MPNYYHHQHTGNSGNPNHVPVSSLYDRQAGGEGVAAVNPNVQRVSGSMMRDYQPPKPPPPPPVLCEVDGCKAYPMKSDDHGLCTGHARSAGLLKPKKQRKVRDDDLE